ncbi:hypothetical protein BKK51_05960 [Rodentibacter trehalosifermentans]|uniref:DUF2681 domain-containing protein n=1 Tax=Rodentibacter trehalosifermentans TaxID=1908263 RepID=A0A1V3ITM0_9PAST|nr:DUF2681 domain-containing protein [Rodentibacter trehalosifermentans]OOF45628.1 hypothetical protein BKK51_05960 [Rodentibacter trehalosifermentans]
MNIQMMLLAIIGGLIVVGYIWHKLRSASREIDRLFKANQELQNQKAMAETQVKHFEVRKKNEENTRRTRRDDLIERLQQSGDLRD